MCFREGRDREFHTFKGSLSKEGEEKILLFQHQPRYRGWLRVGLTLCDAQPSLLPIACGGIESFGITLIFVSLKNTGFHTRESGLWDSHGPSPGHGHWALEWQLINDPIVLQIKRCWLCCRKQEKKVLTHLTMLNIFTTNPPKTCLYCRSVSALFSKTHISCWVSGCGWWAVGWHHWDDWAGDTRRHNFPYGQVALQRIQGSQSDGAQGS